MTTPTAALLHEIAEIGRDPVRGGYSRPGFSEAELKLRAWFITHAKQRGLEVNIDNNGIVWAWWLPANGSREDAIATGSHLDSVPGGGAYDGPLGVASALRAVDLLRAQFAQPPRPLVLMVFPEEEGSRFGLPCLASRLATGQVTPQRVRALSDANGIGFDEAARAAGLDPELVGASPEALARIRAFVELHVEQGRGLADLDEPVAVGRSILAHGRWRAQLDGSGDHAGTTRMRDRHDPVVVAAELIRTVRAAAAAVPDARGTVGKLEVRPGGTNVIAAQANVWFDLRHPEETAVRTLLDNITLKLAAAAEAEGCTASVSEESFSGEVRFDQALRETLSRTLPTAPVLDTGAGHDAGILAGAIPTGMLFVRNPTGTSHAPDEGASDADAEAGSEALAAVLATLLS